MAFREPRHAGNPCLFPGSRRSAYGEYRQPGTCLSNSSWRGSRIFKVLLLPILLFRLLERLHIRGEVEVLLNVPVTMVAGLFVVVFSFALAAPISEMANTVSRGLIGVGLAALLLSFLMMITRRKAVTQVLGFLGMENALFFSAINATYGMPMVVELGVAFDVLVGTFVFGIFFFQIRETFESFDLKHMDNTPTE